jgi:hypothetical protein
MIETIITYMYIVKSCLSFAPLESGGSWMMETIITTCTLLKVALVLLHWNLEVPG